MVSSSLMAVIGLLYVLSFAFFVGFINNPDKG